MKFAARTDIGTSREANEDSYLTNGNLFAVADGMGGHNAGEIASSLALDVFKSVFGNPASGTPDTDIFSGLKTAVTEANAAVFAAAARKEAYSGMGTTLTAAYFDKNSVYLAHVGDSRAYLIDSGGIRQLTRDHTLVNEMILRGELDEELARVHPLRHVITRALGTFSTVEVELSKAAAEPGNIIMLCSDGLSSKLTDDDLLSIVREKKVVDEAAEELVARALAAGGEDNITLVLIAV
jgi:PPM family protein phosphatase